MEDEQQLARLENVATSQLRPQFQKVRPTAASHLLVSTARQTMSTAGCSGSEHLVAELWSALYA